MVVSALPSVLVVGTDRRWTLTPLLSVFPLTSTTTTSTTSAPATSTSTPASSASTASALYYQWWLALGYAVRNWHAFGTVSVPLDPASFKNAGAFAAGNNNAGGVGASPNFGPMNVSGSNTTPRPSSRSVSAGAGGAAVHPARRVLAWGVSALPPALPPATSTSGLVLAAAPERRLGYTSHLPTVSVSSANAEALSEQEEAELESRAWAVRGNAWIGALHSRIEELETELNEVLESGAGGSAELKAPGTPSSGTAPINSHHVGEGDRGRDFFTMTVAGKHPSLLLLHIHLSVPRLNIPSDICCVVL